MTGDDRRRIDKWLWFARFAKTRTAAQKLAVSGRLRVNREKTESASRPVRVGDIVTIASESGVRILKVAALGDRRGPAPEARLLYEDLSPPPAEKPEPGGPASRVGGRPTKRDRRALDAFMGASGAARDDFSPDDDPAGKI